MPETAIPQLADIRQVSDGWIKKYVLTYTLPDGSTYEYESASRKSIDAYRAELEGNARGERPVADAVCIVPQTADGKLLLIREFRYPLNSWCIAFPAGLTEPGEDVATCVDRELREETGYALRADMNAAAALEPLETCDHTDNIRTLTEKKFGVLDLADYAQRSKAFAYLYRCGYESADITDAISRLEQEER